MQILGDVLMFLLYSLLSGTGLITVKMALNEVPFSFANIFIVLFHMKFIVGFMFYAVGFLISLYILSKYSLNVAYPITVSFPVKTG